MKQLTRYRCRDCGTIFRKPDEGQSILEVCDSSDRVVECWRVGEFNERSWFGALDEMRATGWNRNATVPGADDQPS